MSNGCNDLWDVSLHDLRAVYDPEMHLSMLRDCRRHEFYDQCLARCTNELRGKVVIDVGAGTGILSALAARGPRASGAAQVHAVEALPELCKLIPKVLAGALPKEEDRRRVVVHCDFVENLNADVVVSEWLGILGLNEGMALPLLRCRDSFNPRPLMVPGLLRIWIQAAASAPAGAGQRCGPLACSSEVLLGSPCLLLEADLNTCSPGSAADLFEAAGRQLSLKEMESAGLVGWFDLHCLREHEDSKNTICFDRSEHPGVCQRRGALNFTVGTPNSLGTVLDAFSTPPEPGCRRGATAAGRANIYSWIA
eukprot:s501_g16.t1